MDDGSRLQDHEHMRINLIRAHQERRARELADLEAFRTVHRVATEDLRELAASARTSRELTTARAALEAATTAEDVVALEPLVRRVGSVLGVDLPAGRTVRIADRLIPWVDLGGSYGAVVAACRAAGTAPTPTQRVASVRRAQWKDQGRPRI
jgi:hypothetical protein